jgi:hypothetical protein
MDRARIMGTIQRAARPVHPPDSRVLRRGPCVGSDP